MGLPTFSDYLTFPDGCKQGAERLLHDAGSIMNLAGVVIVW